MQALADSDAGDALDVAPRLSPEVTLPDHLSAHFVVVRIVSAVGGTNIGAASSLWQKSARGRPRRTRRRR